MEVESLFIPAANPLVTGYVEGKSEVYRHFHYHYQNPQEYLHRIKDLSERTFMREELADSYISLYESVSCLRKGCRVAEKTPPK